MKLSSALKLLVPLALAGAAAFALLGRAPEAAVAAVKRGRATNAAPATVSVRADYTMELRGETGGRVKSSTLAVGGRVRAGEVVVELDDTELQNELKRLANELAAARERQKFSVNEPALATARDELKKLEGQVGSGLAPPADLDKARREVTRLESAVALEKIERDAALTDLDARITTQRLLIGKTQIRAPDSAQVAAVLAHVGDLLSPGATIATLLADARVVEASISEEKFSGVAAGQGATVRFLGYGEEKFDATVAAVLPTADPATQRYLVRLDVKVAPERLVPGLSGEAEVILGEHAGALLVPRRALLGDFLLVVKDGVVEQRRVKRGFASLTEAEITDGVAEGELVITDELDKFRAGDRVRAARP